MARNAAARPSERCGRWLDAWCDRHCPHRAEHGALRALFDAAQHEMQPRWRCYAASTLNAARTRFESGETYCTRDVQLRKEWARCESETGELPGEATGAASRTAGNVVQPPMPPKPKAPAPQFTEDLDDLVDYVPSMSLNRSK